MGKVKSVIQSKNKRVPKKSSLLNSEEKMQKSKTLSKLQNKSKKGDREFDDMGSLIFLKDVSERKKLGVDERIKVLKNELKSLIGGKNSDKNNDFAGRTVDDFSSNKVIDIDNVCKITSRGSESSCMNSPEYCEESKTNKTKDFKLSSTSMPSKFSVWLDKTIDEMDFEIQKEKITDGDNGQDSKLQFNLTESPSDSPLDLSNISLLKQDQVEQLLYKSFVLQNSEIYLSSSEDSGSEHVKSGSIVKQQNKRSKKQCHKPPKEKVIQGKDNKFRQKARKKRLIKGNSSLSNVEVIDLDSSTSNKEVPKTNHVELDLNNYDWNEPFDLDDNTDFYLDVEIIDRDYKNDAKLNNQNLKMNFSEFLKNDQNGCYIKDGRLQQKGVWECPVCFEQSKGQEVVATQCGHVFCRECLDNHTSKLTKNCPTCRSDLKDKPYITLFNF